MLARFALSLSVDSGARVFVTECDPFCAPQACFEGVQIVAVETVVHVTSLFPQRECSTSSRSGYQLQDASTGAWQSLARPLECISPSCRMSIERVEEILTSKFGSMDQFGWFMDYDILDMLACLVSSVTVLD